MLNPLFSSITPCFCCKRWKKKCQQRHLTSFKNITSLRVVVFSLSMKLRWKAFNEQACLYQRVKCQVKKIVSCWSWDDYMELKKVHFTREFSSRAQTQTFYGKHCTTVITFCIEPTVRNIVRLLLWCLITWFLALFEISLQHDCITVYRRVQMKTHNFCVCLEKSAWITSISRGRRTESFSYSLSQSLYANIHKFCVIPGRRLAHWHKKS